MRRGYWIAFAVCAVAATLPLVVTRTLPMADLPEHMAQVTIWKHFADDCHRFAELYSLNWTTPYLLGYILTRLLAVFMAVSMAVKITVWVSIMLLPLSIRALLARGGGDLWWSLLGFPLAYGYSFYWGFLNFSVALPIAIYAIALLYDRPCRVRAIAGLSLLLVAAHVLLFAFFAAIALCVAVLDRRWRMLLSLAPACAVTTLYIVRLRAEPTAAGDWTWNVGSARILDFPSALFANSWDVAGFPLFVAVVLAIALARPSLTRDRRRWALVLIAGVATFVAPVGAFGTAYLSGRFAVLVAVGALFLFDSPGRRVSRATAILLVVSWMSILTVRFSRFDAEVRDFDRVVESLPPNRAVAMLNVVPFSDHVPGPVYWHFAALYQVRKGGTIAWSFAGLYAPLVRYRAGAERVVRSRTTPVDGIDWPGLLQYDYIVFRAPYARVVRDAPVPLVQQARHGMWWVYATPGSRVARPRCLPVDE